MHATAAVQTAVRRLPWWIAIMLAVAALAVLYAGALRTGFLNDDHMFIEEARTRPLLESLTHLGPLGNYYRPLSRQIYFETLTSVAGLRPWVFHAFNFVLFLAALGLLADLLGAFLTTRGVMAGLLYFALLPFQRVNLTWISCSQDLLALTGAFAALAFYRRGRIGPAVLAYLAAVASKESALPLPLALVAWDVLVVGERVPRIARRVTPFAAIAAGWTALSLWMRAHHAAAAPLDLSPGAFAAGYAHLVQSLLGIEHPSGFLSSLANAAPAAIPFFLLAPLSLWFARTNPVEPGERVAVRRLVAFALVWMAGFGVVVGPVAYGWSAYYYTLAGAGGALLVGLACGRGDRWVWLALAAGLLWWNAGASANRAFATTEDPWVWTSHLTNGYFQRAANLVGKMSKQLKELDPSPPHGTRFFFATLPPFAGFQMGNGALIRNLYGDPSLQSYFYSQFSDSTAGDRPVRILYWDGERLDHLYGRQSDPMFQVGADLLLLDRPQGAAHAFRRGIAEGESQMDNLYWLGWAELWSGRRNTAEAVWERFGAHDDSLRWIAHLRAARNALLEDADTVNAKRHLVTAIEYGIGRPEAHAVLGDLLRSGQPKYAMLELKVAAWLKPDDWLARRMLVVALERARLDEAARRELAELKRTYPEWRSDSALVRVDQALGPGRPQPVANF